MGGEFMQSHSECTFVELEATFCKQHWKVQIGEQVYMALKIIKQTSNKKVEVYYERKLKLSNYLKHKTNSSRLMTFFWAELVPICG
jgi:hypothetical protein